MATKSYNIPPSSFHPVMKLVMKATT